MPGNVLQAIQVPAFTFEISVFPATVIEWAPGARPTPANVVGPAVLLEPQPATAKPTTTSSAIAKTAFTQLVIRRLGGHSGTLAQATVERNRQALELVEPGKHVGDGVVDVGQHAFVVVAGERDVL